MFTSRLILTITNVILGFVEGIIGLRILLKLMGANLVPFVRWIYDTSTPLLYPFEGMLPTTSLPQSNGRYVVEFSALFALMIYALIGYLIQELLAYFAYRRSKVYEEITREVRHNTRRDK